MPRDRVEYCKNWREQNSERLAEYSRDYYKANRAALMAKNKAWAQAHPAAMREAKIKHAKANPRALFGAKIKHRFGIDFLTYSAMLICQSGRCSNSSCAKPMLEPHIDHDHRDLKIRGLLCHQCNTALGMVKDNTHKLAGLISYLEKFNG